jgi:hypothetical protein
MFREFNNNPTGRRVGDCAVRAVSLALNESWERTYLLICLNGLQMGDMPSSNSVWGALLRQNGFYRENLPHACPDCYTVRQFAEDHPKGTYVLGLDQHVVTLRDGDWYDLFDSGDETVVYVWHREENE